MEHNLDRNKIFNTYAKEYDVYRPRYPTSFINLLTSNTNYVK